MGLPKISVSPHKWRHTFAGQVMKSGNLFALQELLGHTDITTTRIYAKIPREELKRVAQRFGPRIDQEATRWYNSR